MKLSKEFKEDMNEVFRCDRCHARKGCTFKRGKPIKINGKTYEHPLLVCKMCGNVQQS